MSGRGLIMGYNVLVAEDERALRNIVSCYLTQSNKKVRFEIENDGSTIDEKNQKDLG